MRSVSAHECKDGVLVLSWLKCSQVNPAEAKLFIFINGAKPSSPSARLLRHCSFQRTEERAQACLWKRLLDRKVSVSWVSDCSMSVET